MSKRLLYSLLLVYALVGSMTLADTQAVARAQEVVWTAWLYQPSDGRLFHVDSEGFILEDDRVERPRGFGFYPFDVTISPNGVSVAYVVSDADLGAKLLVYDTRRNRITLEYDLPDSPFPPANLIHHNRLLFDPTGQALAFGYSQADGSWEVVIFDLTNGRITLVLRPVGTAAAEAGLEADSGLTPIVQWYDGVNVDFTLAETGSIQGQGSYRWNTQTNTVTVVDHYASLEASTFPPTGEVLVAAFDPDFERVGESDFLHTNVLTVYDPSADERFPIFNAGDVAVQMPRFIQNGRRVLINGFDTRGISGWLVLERDGRRVGTWRAAEGGVISGIWGTAEGFLYTSDSVNPGGGGSTTLYLVDTREGLNTGLPLWTSSEGTYARLVWVNDSRLQAADDYVAWARIAPTGETPNPTPIAAASTPAIAPTAVVTAEETELPITTVNTWRAWVYQDSGTATLIASNGSVLDTVQLDSFTTPPGQIAVSGDGRVLVYAVWETARDGTLYIHDTTLTEPLTYAIPHDRSSFTPGHTIERAPNARLFNEHNTQFAFGYGLGEEGWQITILDVLTGLPVIDLRHDSPLMLPYDPPIDFGIVPVIQQFQQDRVTFTLHPSGALQPPYQSYTWDIAANTVTPDSRFASVFNDLLPPTGEIVMALPAPDLPNTAASFSNSEQLNALFVYDPSRSTAYPFFNAPELRLFTPRFIQNGERLLVGGSDASGAFNGWMVIERSGDLMGVMPLPGTMWDRAGVADGFIYIPRDDSAGSTRLVLVHVNTRDGLDPGDAVWTTERTGRPQIAWVGYIATAADYADWGQIGDVVFAADTPTPNAPALQIGGTAVVNTISGDNLIVRIGPGTGFAVAGRLQSGTRVTLIDGPQQGSGLQWWYISTETGLNGWVAEIAENVRTLLPES